MFLEKLTDRLEKLTFIDAFKLFLAVVAVVVVFRACTAGDGFDMPSQETQDQQFYALLDSAYKNFIDNTDDVWIPLYYIGEVSDGVAAVTQSIKDDVAAETYFVWGDVEEEFGHRLSKTVHCMYDGKLYGEIKYTMCDEDGYYDVSRKVYPSDVQNVFLPIARGYFYTKK